MENDNPYGLTKRQQEVMSALCRLGNSKGVSNELGIASRTVDLIVRYAMKRMGAKTRLLAVAQWVRMEMQHAD